MIGIGNLVYRYERGRVGGSERMHDFVFIKTLLGI